MPLPGAGPSSRRKGVTAIGLFGLAASIFLRRKGQPQPPLYVAHAQSAGRYSSTRGTLHQYEYSG